MLVSTFIQGLGSTGFFGSRAFLPAFITAAAMRYGHHVPLLKDSGMIQGLEGAPTWFTSEWCVLILGLLAGLEIAATKVPEARQLLAEVDKYSKSVMALVTYMGVATASDARFIQDNLMPQAAGLLDFFPAFLIAAAVFWIASVRGAVMGFLSDADEDDDAGVQGLFSWAEDVWALAGPLLLILFPLLMIALIAAAIGIIALIRWRLAVREEKTKTPCPSCGTMRYQAAMACPSCGLKNTAPHAIGALGQGKPYPTTDIDRHPLRLASKKRCPVCATRFDRRDPHQTCAACGHVLFNDPDFVKRYLGYIDRRVPLVVLVSLLFSLVPVVGLIPGVIYYRMTIVAPFRQYVPLHRSFLIKWAIRLLFFVLIAFQWVPGLGGFVVPVMAIVSYVSYRTTFRNSLNPGEPSAAAAA